MKIILFSLILLLSACNEAPKDKLKQKQQLGKMLFFDTILSKNNTQSCATCHNPDHGFIDNRVNKMSKFKKMVSVGDDGKSIGNRNTPTAAYAKFSPNFHFKKGEFVGGQFLDGREKDLKGQAGGPPLNPLEMNMPDKKSVVIRLEKKYNKLFKAIYGKAIFDKVIYGNVETAYLKMTEVIAEFEKTKFFSPFDSKYDRYLQGEYELTDLEDLGRSLFFSNNNTNCSNCHQLRQTEDAIQETFSNYQYHNIGVAKNTLLREDTGLLNNPQITDKKHLGKFKVPTLRNVAVTAPYMHNGIFERLETVLAFYDKFINKQRTHNPETKQPWAKAEFEQTVNSEELTKGKKLSDKKIKALLAFLKTLTDKKYEHLLENI